MTKRKGDSYEDSASEEPRIVSGKALVTSLSGEYTELRNHELQKTPGDGLCFVHAVLQQLRIGDLSIAWQPAMAVTQSLALDRDMWKFHLEGAEEQHPERMGALEDLGLDAVLESRRLSDVDLRSFAHIYIYIYILESLAPPTTPNPSRA